MTETIIDRALAAVRFIDAETRRPVQTPLTVKGARVKLARNASSLWVIQAVTGGTPDDAYFESYRTSFEEPPKWLKPNPASIELSVEDPAGRYLSRRFFLSLPREGNALFAPVDVVLYPSPTAMSWCGSTVLRCSVYSMVATKRVPKQGVLLIVSVAETNPPVLGRGLSDESGEALVFLPGIKLLRPNLAAAEGDPVFFDFFLAEIWAIQNPAPGLVDPVEPVKPSPATPPVDKKVEVYPGGESHVYIEL